MLSLLISALKRWTQCLQPRHSCGYRPEPIPRMRWYS